MSQKIQNLSILMFIVALIFTAGAVNAQSVQAKGEIAGVNDADQTILVTTENGFVTVHLDGSTEIIRSKKAVNFASLEIGDSVEVQYDANNQTAQRVIAKKPFFEGFITSVNSHLMPISTVTITPYLGKPVTLFVSSTKILRENKPISLDELQVGDSARIYYEQKSMQATLINAWPVLKDSGASISVLKGFVASLKWSEGILPRLQMGVKTVTGPTLYLFITKQTIVKLNGTQVTANEIQIGDIADIRFDKATKTAIEVSITRTKIDKATIKGHIVTIHLQGDFKPVYVVTIRQGRKDIAMEIAPNAKIERDSIVTDASQLQAGDYAIAKYDPSTMTIFSLSAFSYRYPPG
jgi:hypothetical protein